MASRIVNIKSFGATGPNGYTFENVSRSTTNFSRVESRLTTISGFDGAIDDYGRGNAPKSKGVVSVEMWLIADNEEEMTVKRDEVAALPGWGSRELFLIPYDSTEPERWCYARCIDVKMQEDASSGTNHQQPVTLTFEVANPFWYSLANLRWVGSPALKIGNDWTIRGARTTVTLTDGLEVSVQNRGNAPTPLTLHLSNIDGQWRVGDPGVIIGDPLLFIGGYGPTVGGITVTALDVRNSVLEQWSWNGTLGQHERLIVNSSSLEVTHMTQVADESGWDDFSIVRGTGFIRLAPGTTKIRFNGSFQGGTARLFYMDAWS